MNINEAQQFDLKSFMSKYGLNKIDVAQTTQSEVGTVEAWMRNKRNIPGAKINVLRIKVGEKEGEQTLTTVIEQINSLRGEFTEFKEQVSKRLGLNSGNTSAISDTLPKLETGAGGTEAEGDYAGDNDKNPEKPKGNGSGKGRKGTH